MDHLDRTTIWTRVFFYIFFLALLWILVHFLNLFLFLFLNKITLMIRGLEVDCYCTSMFMIIKLELWLDCNNLLFFFLYETMLIWYSLYTHFVQRALCTESKTLVKSCIGRFWIPCRINCKHSFVYCKQILFSKNYFNCLTICCYSQQQIQQPIVISSFKDFFCNDTDLQHFVSLFKLLFL